MKSLGFLIAFATVIAATKAQTQVVASAQSNAEAWAEAAANGVKVIRVPAGSAIYHKPPPGSRPVSSKSAQAVAGARSAATAQAGHPAKHSSAGQPAQARRQRTSHPQTKAHSSHSPKHQGAHQKPAPNAPLAPSKAQATALAKSLQKPDDKPSPLPLPTLTGTPDDLKKVIQSALTDGLLALTEAQKTTVPLVIAGIHKGLTDAADVISPNNVNKAVAGLVDKSEDVAKAVAAKLAELAVSQADKIEALIEKFVQAGEFAHAAAVGLSVVTTLGLILQNEVLSKIPLDFNKLAFDKLPLEKPPIPLDQWPNLLNIPIPLGKWPSPLDKLAALLEKLPIPLDKLPIPLNKLPIPLDKLPTPLDKLSIPLKQLKKPASGQNSSVISVANSQATAVADGNVADATAQASSAAQTLAGAPAVAVADANADAQTVVGQIPEDLEQEYDDEVSEEVAAVAQVGEMIN